MKLINKQKVQTTYTIELTDEELNLIIASLGEISTNKMKEVLKNNYNYEQELNDTYNLWQSLENISELRSIG